MSKRGSNTKYSFLPFLETIFWAQFSDGWGKVGAGTHSSHIFFILLCLQCVYPGRISCSFPWRGAGDFICLCDLKCHSFYITSLFGFFIKNEQRNKLKHKIHLCWDQGLKKSLCHSHKIWFVSAAESKAAVVFSLKCLLSSLFQILL